MVQALSDHFGDGRIKSGEDGDPASGRFDKVPGNEAKANLAAFWEKFDRALRLHLDACAYSFVQGLAPANNQPRGMDQEKSAFSRDQRAFDEFQAIFHSESENTIVIMAST